MRGVDLEGKMYSKMGKIQKFYYWIRHKTAILLFKDEGKRFSFSVGSPILMQNDGYIQLANKCLTMKEGWEKKYTCEQMKVFAESLHK